MMRYAALMLLVSLAMGGHPAAGADPAEVNPNPLEINVDLAIVTAIIFALLLAVLWKWAWGPIMAGLKKREEGIAHEIAAAQASNLQAQNLLADYQQKLQQAGDEVRAMIESAKKEAEVMKQGIIDEAQRAASAEKDRATREIEAAKNAAIGEIAEHSVNWAFRVASDAVRREIKPDDHRGLIEDALKQFSHEN